MASSQDETAAADDVSATPRPAREDPLARVLDMVRFLRLHCDWDAAQTPRSLLPYLLEEAHEVAHHVEDGDDHALAAELGDLLLHIAFQIVLAQERVAFSADDVADRVIDKMQRRHPHLFGLGEARDWEQLKVDERARAAGTAASDEGGAEPSLLHGLAPGLDPLAMAHRIQDRVAAVGFDWDDWRGAYDKVREEIGEVGELLSEAGPGAETESGANPGADPALEEEIGDLLFAVVNLARLRGMHAGLALGAANRKFRRRFEALERLAPDRGLRLGDASLAELDRLWDEIKEQERGDRRRDR
ncbi:MAG TPA: nucleoside triphosphate pyrophosphohydrolase [Longimicrobiales bacterium]|nr:nucleoside triphosphate pyrophosphohydrolase [Longimicrobiales bacterium]